MIYYLFIFCSCSWVKVDGDEYKLRTGVIVEVIDDMLTIGVIQKIFVVDEHQRLNAYNCTYDAHYHAYNIGDEITCRMVSHSSLLYSGTVHIHTSQIRELYNSFVLLPFALSRHTVVCRAAQEVGAPHHEYINRKKENAICIPM